MPIFEFKCLKCESFMEILVMGSDDEQVTMRCRECGSEDLERVLSSTHYNMAAGGGGAPKGPFTQS